MTFTRRLRGNIKYIGQILEVTHKMVWLLQLHSQTFNNNREPKLLKILKLEPRTYGNRKIIEHANEEIVYSILYN